MKTHRPARGDAAVVTQVSPLLPTAPMPDAELLPTTVVGPAHPTRPIRPSRPVRPTPPPGRTEGMVWVPGDEARGVAGFWIDRFPVTNAAFARFVEATGHVTVAERERISLVFHPPRRVTLGRRGPRGWAPTPGADWRHPRGPRTSLRALGRHPVVHLAWRDVVAYAAWAGLALPTEAEWDCAAGGPDGPDHPWDEPELPGGGRRTNSWQGDFPGDRRGPDGYTHTSPFQAFPANDLGVYDALGNVWEWTADAHPDDQADPAHPAGPDDPADPADPAHHGDPGEPAPCHPRADELAELASLVEPPDGDAERAPTLDTDVNIGVRALKGGSFLCGPGHCAHLRPAARVAMPTGISAGHVGFRCVARAAAPVTPEG